jgi:hypothetical protein
MIDPPMFERVVTRGSNNFRRGLLCTITNAHKATTIRIQFVNEPRESVF